MNRLVEPNQAELRREAILAILDVEALPFRELSRRTEMASGCLRHHLTKLARAGKVRCEKVDCYLYYARTDKPCDLRRKRALDDDGMPELLAAFAGKERHQKAVLDMMPWPRSTTQNRLQRAVRMGLLKQRWQGRYAIYQAVPA